MQNFKLWEMDCWDGYKKVGTKRGKNGQTVNNCVKEDDFVPHMMYDPKTKKGYKAKTKADHRCTDNVALPVLKTPARETV